VSEPYYSQGARGVCVSVSAFSFCFCYLKKQKLPFCFFADCKYFRAEYLYEVHVGYKAILASRLLAHNLATSRYRN